MEAASWTNSLPAQRSSNPEVPERVVAASQRPDGTWRKERKIRAGYIPQDEVARYESKGTQWRKDMPTQPPGYAPEDPAAKMAGMSKSAKKNAKRKQKKANGEGATDEITESLAQATISQPASTNADVAVTPPVPVADPKFEVEKKLRNVRKKVKQCQDLQAKKDSGATLEPEQEEKLGKLGPLLNEVEQLERELQQL